VLYHFVDLALVNAYILANGCKGVPLYEFKVEVALALMYGNSFADPISIGPQVLWLAATQYAENRDPLGGEVPDAVRLYGRNHIPENITEWGRTCMLLGCKKRTRFWCKKCRVYLCIKKDGSCYDLFHCA
jgi:hypothetical protein